MAEEDDRIRYRDIIEPDDSIEKLIKQLEELNKSYETMVNAIRAGADRVVNSIKAASGATSEGRRTIDEAAASTSRLERAQKELKLALSDTGKQIAWLKAQTADANRATVEQQRYLQQAVTSYDRLKSDLKEAVALYKSLTEAERADSVTGQQLLNTILNLKNQIKALDDSMRPHIAVLTETEKAEQRLAFLQSAEGQRLLDLKAKIAAITAERKNQNSISNMLAQAHERLAFANSKENEQLKLYTTLAQEANRIAQLNAQISASKEGSYNRLSAQYALNKIRLNQMSTAEREATDAGKELEAETQAIYQRMIKLQEATGNYSLSVGHYQKTWDGLGHSVTQVVRELPAAAVSLNTFFLGISNNVPIVIDEIRRLRAQNAALAAEGKPTVNITKQIISSLMGWNTWLIIVLTTLSMYGKQISGWIVSLFKGKNAVISLTDALSNIAEELEKNNGGYGDNIVSLKQLQQEWKNLETTAEKNQWIKDNKSEFDKLGISVNDVTEAENVFVNNTGAVINALRQRARAAAAQKLAAEQYEKALVKRNEAELEETKKRKRLSKRIATGTEAVTPGQLSGVSSEDARRQVARNFDIRIKDLKDEADAIEKTGDAYFDLYARYEAVAKAELAAAGIEEKHKKDRKKHTHKREPRDLTDAINRNQISLQRQYEESITKLTNDEYAKRRKAAADQVQDANNKLREMYRKNVEYISNVDKKYKELTEDQKKQIEQQQQWIAATIANNLQLLSYQLEQIQKEQQINALKIRREAINAIDTGAAVTATQKDQPLVTTQVSVAQDTSGIEQSLIQERKLVQENLELEYQLILDTNKRLREAGDSQARSEEEILIELNKKKF